MVENITDWHESDLLSNGVRLHIYRTCSAAEALEKRGSVVLCHGFSDDGPCWSALARELEADYDVVMVDARYHGRSEVPRTGSDPDAMSADLAGLIDGLGLDRPVVAGHSMGASYVFRAAALYPELMRAIILEDPVWFDGQRAGAAPDQAAQLAHYAESSQEQLVAEFREQHPTWDEETLSLFAASKKRLHPAVLERVRSGPTWREALAQITCSMLVFTGDPERGAIVSEAVVAAAQEMHSSLERAHIPGVGHHIRYGAPQPYTDAFKRYLAEM